MEQLPLINYPYISEVEFLQEVKNIDGRAKKTTFKHDRITSPFYFLVKIKEVENNGVLTVCFYTTANVKAGESDKKVAEKTFHFGEEGKYYEYIIFFDRVENLEPGRYRYAIFCNQRLIYEGQLVVNPREGEEKKSKGNYKSQIPNYKQIPNYNDRNYKQEVSGTLRFTIMYS